MAFRLTLAGRYMKPSWPYITGRDMKSAWIIVLAVLPAMLTIATGCDRQHSVTDGITNTPMVSTEQVTLLRLPKTQQALKKKTVSVYVTPQDTLDLKAKLSYNSLALKPVNFEAKLTIPRGAVSQPVTITMTLDTVLAKIEFEPSGIVFNKPLLLDVILANLDPISYSGMIDFLYLNPNGTYGKQEFQKIQFWPKKGNVTMKEGKIYHFSAYAFGRRTAEENGW